MQQRDRAWLSGGVMVTTLIGVAALTVFAISHSGRSAAVQDTIRLESRITQVEQRLYSMEINIRNLEQQSRLGTTTSRVDNSEDVLRLRSDLQLLQRRVIDDECALAKLDERTLTAQTREARRRSGANRSDPCRTQVDLPVVLPDRP